MNKTIENSVKNLAGTHIMKGFRWHWVLYGAAAYFGVRYLYSRGILPNQTGAALNAINKGVDFAKNQIGLNANDPNERQAHKNEEPIVHH
ncbi:MAG: hypothetical protein JNL11_05680 [Bdellovibrionaceae bacterium]|nr:hypothetical protein [Pseudobdellovibrionaceae bacterium]